MIKTRVIPCLLLRNLGLVKTVKFSNPKYVGDPINAVKIFNDKEVDELIFLDITATAEERKPNYELLSRIACEAFMPFSYGGGIRTIEDVTNILRIGVEKVAINSYAFENPEFIKDISAKYGSQSVIVSIDVRKVAGNKYEVFLNNGKKKTGMDPISYAVKMEKMGAGEIFLNSIDNDGMMNGYETELIRGVSEATGIPVIACGGAGAIKHFGDAVSAGASAVSAGSFFVFVGPHRAVLISYPDQVELCKVFDNNAI
jgi:imidazole glycerol-phosphate synthase subunit HisF